MFKYVLNPLDGSSLAEKAIGSAQQMVEQEGKLILLTVLPEMAFLIPHLAASEGTPISTTSNVVIKPTTTSCKLLPGWYNMDLTGI